MNCTICRHGETRPGTATVTLVRDGTTVIIQGVPADVCENCGEEYVAEPTGRNLLGVAEEAATSGVKLDLRDYRAA